MDGFFQSLLLIDLSTQEYCVKPLEEALLARYLGGKGLAAHLLLQHNPAGVDPFAPENHLILALGPVTDGPVYGSCRYGIFSKSPLTGFYAESYSGGSLAIYMSRTGYDAIMIKGAAKKPVWLEINDKAILFHDAGHLWGKDTYAAEALIKQEIGDIKSGIMVIGPAGENLVRQAVVQNDTHRVAGRTGMGAVLGAKKIKGIAFYGSQVRPLADPEGIKRYSKEILKRFRDHPATQACRTCFLACDQLIEVQQGLKLEGPEYETIYAFGGLCRIDEIEEIAYLNDICDRLGLDTISAGNLAAFAIEASRRGKISEALDYGDPDGVAVLLKKIVRREGVGGLLAEGIRFAAKELDMEDIAIHVKGLEPPGYDPRVFKGMGLGFAVSDRGACHLRAAFYKAELTGLIAPEKIEAKAELFLDFEDRCTLLDCFILCRFYRDFYTWEALSKIIELTCGLKFDKTGLQALAAWVTDNTRRFNIREGLTAADDWLPKRFFKERLPSGHCLVEQEQQTFVQDYYRLRGWTAAGVPPEEEKRG